jgi:hypothetical protein
VEIVTRVGYSRASPYAEQEASWAGLSHGPTNMKIHHDGDSLNLFLTLFMQIAGDPRFNRLLHLATGPVPRRQQD